MAWNIPNVADVAFARQSGIYSAGLAGLVAALAGDGVISGCGVTAQGSPDTTVAVAAGLIRIEGFFCYVTGANVSGFTGDGSNPRIDLVVVDYNGALSRVAGTAAAQPVAPAIPAHSISLAQIYIPTSDVTIASNQISDRRVLVPDYFDYAEDFLGGSINGTQGTRSGAIGGILAWASSGTDAAPTFQSAVASHPGVLRSVTGASSGNNERFNFGNASNTASIAPADCARIRAIVAIPTITSCSMKIGMGQDFNDAVAASLGTAGAWFEFVPATDSHWRTVTRQAGTATANNSTITVTAGNWYQLDIVRMQNGNYQFVINGTLAFTHSANQPSTVCTLGTLTHTLTTAARNIDHDFFGFNLAPIAQRFT